MHNPLTATCPRLGTVKTTTARARETNETSCSNTDCESVHGWRSAVVRETGRWGGVCTHRHTHTASTLLIELASAYTPARARVCLHEPGSVPVRARSRTDLSKMWLTRPHRRSAVRAARPVAPGGSVCVTYSNMSRVAGDPDYIRKKGGGKTRVAVTYCVNI